MTALDDDTKLWSTRRTNEGAGADGSIRNAKRVHLKKKKCVCPGLLCRSTIRIAVNALPGPTFWLETGAFSTSEYPLSFPALFHHSPPHLSSPLISVLYLRARVEWVERGELGERAGGYQVSSPSCPCPCPHPCPCPRPRPFPC